MPERIVAVTFGMLAVIFAIWGVVAWAAPVQSYSCKGPVDIELLEVVDWVELDTGCTGSIGTLRVLDATHDGVKVKNASVNAAHDLTIGRLEVTCRPAPAGVHQDGVQVLGGARISVGFAGGVDIRGCRTSQVMLKKGGSGRTTPTDVVFANGFYGPGAAHTFIVGTSLRSGVRDSVACPDTTKFNGAIEVAGTAQQAVNVNNVQPASC